MATCTLPKSTLSPRHTTARRLASVLAVSVLAIASSVVASASATAVTKPSSPSITSFVGGDTRAVLTFAAAASNGGDVITDYKVEYKAHADSSWRVWTHAPSTSVLTYTITGLTNGTSYDAQVTTVGKASNSNPSSVSSVTPATTPNAPSISSFTAGNGQAIVTFSAPSSDGGSAITDYKVEYKVASVGSWSTWSHAASSSTLSYAITGLTNGTAYRVRISAVNAVGTGTASSSASATPVMTPDSPSITSFTRGNEEATVTFSAPNGASGSSVTNYLVEYKATSETLWTTFGHDVSTATLSYTITGLTNGTSYDVRVSAMGKYANSIPSSVWSATPATLPSAPSVSSFTSGNGQATVTFAAPSSDGGSAITDYKIEYKVTSAGSWSTFNHALSSSTLSYTITGLTNGTPYNVRVSALNSVGTGAASGTASATPATTASAPNVSSLTAGNGQATLVFVVPSSDGGAAITDYKIEYKTAAEGSWSTFGHAVSSSTLSYTITGLTNGTSYNVRVSAVNAMGTGSASNSASVTPVTTPGAPRIDSVTAGDSRLTINFIAPRSDGGSEITNYEYSLDNGFNWVASVPAATASPIVVTGLFNGTAYSVKLRARNSVGYGSANAAISATPAATPNAPSIDDLIAGNGELTVAIAAPDSDGGAAVTDYLIEYKASSAGSWTTLSHDASAETLTYAISGLTNGISYDVRVSAINPIGRGAASPTASAIPVATPDAPSVDSVTAGNGQLTINFAAPRSDGGAGITSYEYSLDDGSNWVASDPAATVSPIVVSGLTNGTAYSVRLRAVNSVGPGFASATILATPVTTPDAPIIDAVTAGNGQLMVSFAAPDGDGGSAITDYLVEYKRSSRSAWTIFDHSATATTMAYTIDGLSNGTSYDIRVSAINAVGLGTASQPESATPVTTPGAPSVTALTAGNGQLTVTFAAPGNNGGTAITDYKVDYKATAASSWITFSHVVSASTLTYVITGLTNGASYDVRVSALNAVGLGTASDSASGTPVTTPGAPNIAAVVAGNGQLTATFAAPDSDGGTAITDYRVEYKRSSAGSWSTLNHSASAATLTYTINGLTNGTSYDVRVSAVNAVGTGSASAKSSATPVTTPDAPIIASVTGGIHAFTVTLSSSVSDGGTAITDYLVEYKRSIDSSWTLSSYPASTAPVSYTITGLRGASPYDVRVSSVNAVGTSNVSTISSVTTAQVGGPASAPKILWVKPANASVKLGFRAPKSNGGTEIEAYEYTLDNGVTWAEVSPASTDRALVVSGLVNGAHYVVKVRAMNGQGGGATSNARSVTPRTVPSAPVITSVVSQAGEITIRFNAPAFSGGNMITRYGYTFDGVWHNYGAASNFIIIRGLKSGVRYPFAIQALNSAGWGASSNVMEANIIK